MTSHIALSIGSFQRINEIRRIAYHRIIQALMLLDLLLQHRDTLLATGIYHILQSLFDGSLIYIESRQLTFGETLSHH